MQNGSLPLPGTRRLRWATDWFDPATTTQVFEPLVADWRHERLQGDTWHSRAVISLRGQLAFLGSSGRMAPALLISPMPAGLAAALVTRVTVFVGAASLLMRAPCIREYRYADAAVTPPVWLGPCHLSPQAITFVLPFTAIGAVDLVRSRLPGPGGRGRWAALQLALIAAVAMVLASGWWVADANRRP